MLNLRSAANKLVQAVNPDIWVTVFAATGYTVGTGQKQTPTYAAGVSGWAQLQELNSSDIKLMNGFQTQTSVNTIYLKGPLHGIVRKTSTGGDYIMIGSVKWLVQQILEEWPNWSKAAIIMQVD